MVDLFEALLARHSVRSFEGGELPSEDLSRMLEAAQHAPSAGNGQPWRFLVLRDRKRRQVLSEETIFHVVRDLERRGHPPETVEKWRGFASGLASRLLEAPAWVLLFVDNRRYPGFAVHDGALAAQNLMLAAHGLGYGSSYQTTIFPEAAVLAHFGMPDCYSFICLLPIGKPAGAVPDQQRTKLSPVIWEECYPGETGRKAATGGIAGDVPLVEIVYSPACPVNAHFVAAAHQWLRPFVAAGQIEVSEVRTDRSPDRASHLLGLRDLGELQRNVFIRVFVRGREVSAVPLHPDDVCNGVCDALGLPRRLERQPVSWWGPVCHQPKSVSPDALRFELLTKENLGRSLELCLCLHPASGLTPAEYHEAGRLMKLGWLEQAWADVSALGLIALDGERPAGLVEAYPRLMAREAGFATGRETPDGETLTVTCIEVAGGYPRLEVIDFLMSGLVGAYKGGHGRFRWMEGMGVYGQTTGTNPYWVFEKYGFSRIRDLIPGRRALLRREL